MHVCTAAPAARIYVWCKAHCFVQLSHTEAPVPETRQMRLRKCGTHGVKSTRVHCGICGVNQCMVYDSKLYLAQAPVPNTSGARA